MAWFLVIFLNDNGHCHIIMACAAVSRDALFDFTLLLHLNYPTATHFNFAPIIPRFSTNWTIVLD